MKNNVIVFVSHNSAELVMSSIHALGPSFRICIVENGSESSYQKLSDFSRQTECSVEVHHVDNNGFGSACNLAAKSYPGANLLFLNPDCSISPTDVNLLFERLDNEPGCVVAPTVYDHVTGAIQNYRWGWTGKWTVLFMWLNLGRFRRSRKSHREANTAPPLWVAGSAFAINAATMLQHGGFDEKFFLYFEEEDLFRRIVGNGGRCLIESSAKAIHEAGTSTSERKNKIREFMLVSGLYYIRKWYGRDAWTTLASTCKVLLATRASDIFMYSDDRSALSKRIRQSEFASRP